jgi:hypothetical protein
MRKTLLRFAGPCIAALAIALPADGQTVINVPPDEAPTAIGSNTQLNLFEAGSLANGFNAGSPNGLSTNVEVNVSGGTVGTGFNARPGSTVNISGGVIGNGFDAFNSSTVNISGGIVHHSFDAHSGSTVNLSGGSVRGFGAFEGTMLNIFGGEFRLDGVPITGLEVPGSTFAFNPPEGTLLSGTLADGTPLAAFFFIHGGADRIDGEVLTLHAISLPAIGPAVIDIPSDAVPLGIRQGQTLNLGDGGSLRDQFTAARGSTLNISGGTVGEGFQAVAAEVTISGGAIGRHFIAREGSKVDISGDASVDTFFALDDSTVHISGGAFPDHFTAEDSTVNISGGVFEMSVDMVRSTLNISGGLVGMNRDGSTNLRWEDSTVNITDGTVGPFFARDDTTVNITGGTVQEFFTAVTGSTVNLFAGTLKESFRAAAGGTVNIFGGTVEHVRENQIGINAVDGGTVNISGGSIDGGLELGAGGTVNIFGGSLDGTVNARSGSTLNIFGTEFFLDGLSIAGLENVGDSVILSERDGAVLQATLRDGGPLDLPLSADRFHTEATLRLTLAEPVPEPSTFGLALVAALGLSARRLRRRRKG